MSIYSTVESGTSWHRTRFHKSISYEKDFDVRFGDVVPILEKFCLPGDVWRIGGEVLVRFQPMLSPSLTKNYFKVRYFFIPLRQIEENAELIITGSQDGKLYTSTLPVFKNFVDDADKVSNADAYKVQKYDFWDYIGVPCLDYEGIKTNECLPAQYWAKAYLKLYWDFYDDENLGTGHSNFQDFEAFAAYYLKNGADMHILSVEMKKDYFMSSLPWQLKGTVPVLNVTGSGTINGFDFGTPATFTGATNNHVENKLVRTVTTTSGLGNVYTNDDDYPPFAIGTGSSHTEEQNISDADNWSKQFAAALNGQSVSINGLGFSGDDLRTMMAQTRIFERLARTGSRYTEYLRANFGIAPADGTLQRAQYLGGWSIPIVTTEVLQTAQDEYQEEGETKSNPVGTMRGHGITRGGQRIQTFHCKEFGVLLGVAHIMPETVYTQGINKELSYKKRFDIFNPSFQHLSEQEVRNGEIFVSNSDGKNDNTFGFQAYANELRSSMNKAVGDMRDGLSFWNQALHFTSRPNLNTALLRSSSHRASFNAPFAVSGENARPCIVQFYNDLDVYRPMVRYSTPGLVDHL